MKTFVVGLNKKRIYPKYNLLLNTGRTSCSKPNFQQLPRKGGIRELFIADKDKKFIITDYSTIELCTLSQVTYNMYGFSVMRNMINDGVDLHKYYASILLGKKIEDVTKDERQYAKAANFGFPGGLGIETFIQFAKVSYGLKLDYDRATEMKHKWIEAFPEMSDYLQEETGTAMTLTGRVRGDTTFCAEKNTPFQGLAADGAKIALYYLDREGFDIVGFVHDEIISEATESDIDEAVHKQEKIMVEAMQIVVPDVKITVESQISKRYCK